MDRARKMGAFVRMTTVSNAEFLVSMFFSVVLCFL